MFDHMGGVNTLLHTLFNGGTEIDMGDFYRYINNLNYKRLLKAGAKYIAISSYIWDNPKLKPELAIKMFI